MIACWVSLLPRLPARAVNPAAPLSPPAPLGWSRTHLAGAQAQENRVTGAAPSALRSSLRQFKAPQHHRQKKEISWPEAGGYRLCCSRDKPLAFAAAEPGLAASEWASLPSSTAPCHLLPRWHWPGREWGHKCFASPQHLLSWACFAGISKLDLNVRRGTWREMHHSSDPCSRLNHWRAFVILPGYSLEAGWNYWESFLITWVSHFPICVVFLDISPVRGICALKKVLTLSELPMVLLA